jgi:hypothetical protein
MFIYRTLLHLMSGDILMYADSGCEFKSSPAPWMAAAEEKGFLGFQMVLPTRMWTKGDVFAATGMDMSKYADAGQHMATVMLMKRGPPGGLIMRVMAEWLTLSADPQLITDAPSKLPNHADFRDHRHDQAIYSLLVYKYGLPTLADDTAPGETAPIVAKSRRNRL